MKYKYLTKQLIVIIIGIIALEVCFLFVRSAIKDSLVKKWADDQNSITKDIELELEGESIKDDEALRDALISQYVGDIKVKYVCYLKSSETLSSSNAGAVTYSDFEECPIGMRFQVFLASLGAQKQFKRIDGGTVGYTDTIAIGEQSYYLIYSKVASPAMVVVGFVDSQAMTSIMSVYRTGFHIMIVLVLAVLGGVMFFGFKESGALNEEKTELIKTMREKDERADVLSYLMNDFSFEYDFKSDVISFSEKYATIFHRGRNFIRFKETIRNHFTIYHKDVDNLLKAYNDVLNGSDEGNFIFRLQMLNGQYEWFSAVFKTIFNSDGRPTYAVGKIYNIHESQKEKEALLSKSTKDPLTGLLNRGELEKRTQAYIDNMADEDHAALLIMDLDHFKSVNDNFGHSKGDDLLREISNLLMSEFRTTDIVGRLGGDEFYVFMKDISSMEDAITKCKSVLEKVRRSITYDDMTVDISTSMGIVEVVKGGKFLDLYMKADASLYDAKESGRNRLCIYND
ncbi:MAG: sensor domain-containing diguanylate cyclase [Lachnospiraceae bacterium]|nr:sensor domain-containing diguanylate cyclase [Lachnospiraceae bacterium]